MSLEANQKAMVRWSKLQMLRDAYPTFEPFLRDCMTSLMGFQCSDIQVDIGEYLQYGPQYLMIQAQRSQAKSTIVAIFAVWLLIHDPKHRVVVLSAGSKVAKEIANWIIQIIMNWEILECLRPDKTHGDRASTEAFDVHYHLKGVEKSPSVACLGVTANMQGIRADFLVPDDIESSKNGTTEVQRENLIHLSRDFTSICQSGRICYLGTPQTTDSIYNTLPGRGYSIRIWPGRYPTEEQMDHYGEFLAPLLRKRLEADPSLQTGGGVLGDQGQATDPLLVPEEALQKKENDQGTPYFQLQHMLNTELMDADRYPLKAKDLIVGQFSLDRAPGRIDWMPDPQRRVTVPGQIEKLELYYPFATSDETFEYEGKMLYIDPAGKGEDGDETVVAATYQLHGYVFLMELLALPGGYQPEYFEAIADMAYRHGVHFIQSEENFGHGAFAQMLRPVLLKYYNAQGKDQCPNVEDVNVTGQKEIRIADTLGPLTGRHRLIVHEDVFKYDVQSVAHRPAEKRVVYMLSNQLTRLTRDRNALIQDDRIDAVAGGCNAWVERIAIDEDKRIAQKSIDEAAEFMQGWVTGGAPEQRMAAQTTPNPLAGLGRSNALRRRRGKRKRRL